MATANYVFTVPLLGVLLANWDENLDQIQIDFLLSPGLSEPLIKLARSFLVDMYLSFRGDGYETNLLWDTATNKANICIVFAQKVKSPESFLWAQCKLLANRWAKLMLQSDLRVYLEHLWGFDREKITAYIEKFFKEHKADFEKYDWFYLRVLDDESLDVKLELVFCKLTSRSLPAAPVRYVILPAQ